jgi:hypothetical protein
MVAEFGVDAYNTDCGDPNSVGVDVGCEDEEAQAEWVMSLTEDIERHSSACKYGCVPEESRVVLGGAIIGWADEWWKGRVIDATEFDARTWRMGAACPDPYAHVHSPCGYPSGAQPDQYVNEEWFGLFKAERRCVDGPDRIRPRTAWERIRMLWRRGGCLGYYDTNGTYEVSYNYVRNFTNGTLRDMSATFRVHAPYNVTRYPRCAEEVDNLRVKVTTTCAAEFAAARADQNESLITTPSCYSELALIRNSSNMIDMWDGTDCSLQKHLADVYSASGLCPPVPAHMQDINRTVAEAKLEWTPNPEVCKDESISCFERIMGSGGSANGGYSASSGGSIWDYILWPLVLCIINHRVLSRLLCRRGRFDFLSRGAKQDMGAAPSKQFRRALLTRPGSHKGSKKASQQPSLKRLADDNARDEDLLPLRQVLGPCIAEPPPHVNVVGAEMRAARDGVVREILVPIGQVFAETFGFQTYQQDAALTGTPERVPSNLDNQIDHLVALLSQRLDRQVGAGAIGAEPDVFAPALERAVRELHEAMLGSYMDWVRHVQLRSRTPVQKTLVTVGSFAYANASDFGVSRTDSAARCVCNMQLHRLMLYMLMWGEAANLRHVPECLCLIFYCISNTLVFTHPGYSDQSAQDAPGPTRHSPGPIAMLAPTPREKRGGRESLAPRSAKPRESLIPWSGKPRESFVPPKRRSIEGMPASQLASPPFLEGVVTPIYEFLAHEINSRREEVRQRALAAAPAAVALPTAA